MYLGGVELPLRFLRHLPVCCAVPLRCFFFVSLFIFKDSLP